MVYRNIPWVIFVYQQSGDPFITNDWRHPQRGYCCIGHCHGAKHTTLSLGKQVSQRRVCNLSTGPRIFPGKTRNIILDRQGHQFMVGRMVVNLINTHPIAVESTHLGWITVGKISLSERFGRTGVPTKLAQSFLRPTSAFSLDAFVKSLVI